MNNVYKKSKILDCYVHGCEYTFWDDTLMTRHDESEEWVEVMLEHCMSEGINHYDVYKYFGKEILYVDILLLNIQKNKNDSTEI
tara:strand:+ start:282 stop:533 length:252 start_codon:yes stop_codon:yes gene_type:complete